MEEDIDIRKELEQARRKASEMEFKGTDTVFDAYMEVICGDVLLAEKDLEEQDREWEIASLAREFLQYARPLEGYDHLLNRLQWAASRMSDTVHGHPRLKLKLLDFELLLLHRIEAQSGHELGSAEDLQREIFRIMSNIELADKGLLDQIRTDSHLKHDPVEWTAEWEEIIDEADRKVYEALADQPRGMGFCHAFWFKRMEVLRNDYGIQWKSPAIMNPGVHFD